MCNNNKVIRKWDTLIVPLYAGQGTYQLPNDNIITNAKKVKGARAYYASTAGMVGPNGETLVDAATFRSGYITFTNTKNIQDVNQIPLLELALTNASGYPQELKELDLQDINPTKCQVFFGDTSAITTGMNLLIAFNYED